MPHHLKYRVVAECSSSDSTEVDIHGRQVLFAGNNFLAARKECIEWAAYDDILVQVLRPWGAVKFTCDGAGEAETRYPKTAAMV